MRPSALCTGFVPSPLFPFPVSKRPPRILGPLSTLCALPGGLPPPHRCPRSECRCPAGPGGRARSGSQGTRTLPCSPRRGSRGWGCSGNAARGSLRGRHGQSQPRGGRAHPQKGRPEPWGGEHGEPSGARPTRPLTAHLTLHDGVSDQRHLLHLADRRTGAVGSSHPPPALCRPPLASSDLVSDIIAQLHQDLVEEGELGDQRLGLLPCQTPRGRGSELGRSSRPFLG